MSAPGPGERIADAIAARYTTGAQAKAGLRGLLALALSEEGWDVSSDWLVVALAVLVALAASTWVLTGG